MRSNANIPARQANGDGNDTPLLEASYDIRTVQELLGHKDVRTIIVYTHVLNRGGRGVHSPLDLT
jgi:integrase